MLQNKLFAAMTEDDIATFINCAQPTVKTFRPGQIILDQGEETACLLLLLEGEAELYKEDYEGNRSRVGALNQGETYGEQVIFGQEASNGFQLVASSAVKVMYIDQGLFYRPCSKVCPAHQGLIRNMLGLLADQANLLEKKITYLTAKGLRKKIAIYLWEEYLAHNRNATYNIALNREEMAAYFDVQRPSLSRELVALKHEGIIDYYRSTFKILDLEKLKENTR